MVKRAMEQEAKHRGHNDGSVFQRKDGRWCAAVTYLDEFEAVRRKRWYFSGDDAEKRARDRLKVALADLVKGLPVAPEQETVERFLDRWFVDVSPSLEPKTVRSYEQAIRLYLVPAIGAIKLSRLTPQDVQRRLINAMTARGLSARTVEIARAVLRKALNDAMSWGRVSRNAAALARPPKRTHTEKRYLAPAEARAFLTAIAGHRHEAIFTAALALGLRQGEVLALRWADVDFDAGTVEVVNQLQRVNGVLTLKRLKSRTSHRTLPLPVIVADALKVRRKDQIAERLALGPYWQNPNDLIFTTEVGTPHDARNIMRDFAGLREKAGVPWLTFHGLRHGFGSLLAARGIHPRIAMELMGHSEFRLTMEIYSHVAPELAKEAAMQIDQALGS